MPGADAPKPGVTRTQFGELMESHSTLEFKHLELTMRFDRQDQKLLGLENLAHHQGRQIDSQSKELHANTQATKRVELKVDEIADKTKDFVDVADYARKTFLLVEWVIKRLLPLVVGAVAVLGGIGWLSK